MRGPLRLILVAAIAALATAGPPLGAQQTRIASDFEIAQMERLAASERGFLAQIAAHLNLGDLRATRSETALARREFNSALGIAEAERSDARQDDDLARYATATLYAALAEARLGRPGRTFTLAEEAARYAGSEAKTWNLVSAAMAAIDQPRQAVSAARNAVALAERDAAESASTSNLLDLSIYRYQLASSLERSGAPAEAVPLLEAAVATLQSKAFDGIRKKVARSESFEIYSTARGEPAAYLSALNRSQLKLAAILEQQGEAGRARSVYRDVLAGRSDDPVALAALARLARTDEERGRRLAESLDANPFSIDAIRAWQKFLAARNGPPPALPSGDGAGAGIRRALEQMQAGENRAARTTLDTLAASFPDNDVVEYLGAVNDLSLGDVQRARARTIRTAALRREVDARLAAAADPVPSWLDGAASSAIPSEAELTSVLRRIAQDLMTPAQRAALDRVVLTADVRMHRAAAQAAADETVFDRGMIGEIPFAFGEPTAFKGSFSETDPLRLQFRILGATDVGGAQGLLLEPVRLEVAR